MICFFFQAEDGIRDLVRSRGLGDVYKRQTVLSATLSTIAAIPLKKTKGITGIMAPKAKRKKDCLLYTSDAADERSSVDLGGRRIIKKKNTQNHGGRVLE